VFLSGGKALDQPITEALGFLHTHPRRSLALGSISHTDVDAVDAATCVTRAAVGGFHGNLAVEVFQLPVEVLMGVDADTHGVFQAAAVRTAKNRKAGAARMERKAKA